MIKLIYEKTEPSGEVRIVIPDLNIVKWISYVWNSTFYVDGAYEEMITKIEEDNSDKILVVINDNSDHAYVKRCFIRVYTEDDLKN